MDEYMWISIRFVWMKDVNVWGANEYISVSLNRSYLSRITTSLVFMPISDSQMSIQLIHEHTTHSSAYKRANQY